MLPRAYRAGPQGYELRAVPSAPAGGEPAEVEKRTEEKTSSGDR